MRIALPLRISSWSEKFHARRYETAITAAQHNKVGKQDKLIYKEWCCVIQADYSARCGTCPYPEHVTEYFVNANRIAKQGRRTNSKGRTFNFRAADEHFRSAQHNQEEASKLTAEERAARKLLRLSEAEAVRRKVVKKAFKKVAMKMHPDMNPENASEEDFKKLVRAYEFLLSRCTDEE